jgi:signal transduction histidine kinase
LSPSLRSTAPVFLITACVSGLLCFWAVSDAPTAVRSPLAWGAAAAIVAAVTAIAHVTSARDEVRQRNAVLSARINQLTTELQQASEDVRRSVTDSRGAVEAAARSESNRAAAISACANAAGRMQALATSMLADLREMENRHNDEDVLGDLLHLDHRTAQAGRLADSLAVLTGSRSGRRWAKPIVMESILRGAMGRISGYQRVRLHSTSEVAIAGHAAEGVMHALAELLDNAANFSPPTAEVHVYVEEVPAGIVITVEDSGLVMSDVQLRRAEQAVTREQSDLGGLSGTRLGLAVVGRLSRKHGLKVSFRPSARGGTGALMMLPQELITQLRPGTPGPANGLSGSVGKTGTRTEAAAPAPEPITPLVKPPIPRRTPKRPAASAAPPATAASPAPAPAPERTPASESESESGSGSVSGTASRVRSTPNANSNTSTSTSGAASAASARSAPARETTPAPDTDTDPTPDTEAESVELGESGLPKRRRGHTLAAALHRTGEAKSGSTNGTASTPDASPAAQAARFSSFRKALRENPQPPTNPTQPDPEGESR